jgi:hypothetical protein
MNLSLPSPLLCASKKKSNVHVLREKLFKSLYDQSTYNYYFVCRPQASIELLTSLIKFSWCDMLCIDNINIQNVVKFWLMICLPNRLCLANLFYFLLIKALSRHISFWQEVIHWEMLGFSSWKESGLVFWEFLFVPYQFFHAPWKITKIPMSTT